MAIIKVTNTLKFGFTKRVDKGWIATVKGLESSTTVSLETRNPFTNTLADYTQPAAV